MFMVLPEQADLSCSPGVETACVRIEGEDLVTTMHLRVDPKRRLAEPLSEGCGFYTPAFDEHGHTCTAAIEELDKDSLVAWLQSRATREYVEDVVLVLLGHGRSDRVTVPTSTSRRFWER